MGEEIKWERGKFLSFRAKMKIRIGGSEVTCIEAGDQFKFDGWVCFYKGKRFKQPGLRGAISEAWTVQNDILPVAKSRAKAIEHKIIGFFVSPNTMDKFDKLAKKFSFPRTTVLKLALMLGIQEILRMTPEEVTERINKFRSSHPDNRYMTR